MKIVLIHAPIYSTSTPHLGLAYLTSVLKNDGHDVTQTELNLQLANTEHYGRLENFNKNSLKRKIPILSTNNKESIFINKLFDFYTNKILDKKPDIVGFSINSHSIFYSFLLARKIKKSNKKIKIVIGGPITNDKDLLKHLFEKDFVDFIVKGEGELAFLELIKSLQQNKNLTKITYKKEINDIDMLPFPEFQNSDIQLTNYPHILPLIISRGCTGRCTFCIERSFLGKYRQRSIKNIIEEFKYQKNKHGIDTFWLNDSLINGDMNIFSSLCDEIIKENLEIYWGGNIRIHPKMTYEFCGKMYKAGCRFLRIGVESASQKVLNHMNKGINAKTTENVIKNSYKANIYTHIFIIAGYSAESNKDFLKTFNFLIENNNNICSFFVHKFTFPKAFLEPNNPLFKIKEKTETCKQLRHDILKFFANSDTDEKFYGQFLNIRDLSDYKNSRTNKSIFIRPLIINNKYYDGNKVMKLNNENYFKIKDIDDIEKLPSLTQNQKKIFLSLEINNNFKKINKRLNQIISKLNNNMVFTRPLPRCISKNIKNKKLLENIPKSCSDCLEFLKIENEQIYICRNFLKYLKNEENMIHTECKECLYFLRKQCFPCYILPQDDIWVEV